MDANLTRNLCKEKDKYDLLAILMGGEPCLCCVPFMHLPFKRGR